MKTGITLRLKSRSRPDKAAGRTRAARANALRLIHFLRAARCSGLLSVSILAGITICIALANATSPRLRLPIEVLGGDGTTLSTSVILEPEQAQSVRALWLQTNGLRYSHQGSVQVNAGPWIPLNNDTVTVDEPGRSYGGIGGGFATLRMTLLLPKGAAVVGANTVRFRFDHTDGVSSGYRVLAWNFLTSEGKKIVPPEEFAEENPDTWSPPLPDYASIQAGRELWHNSPLTACDAPNCERIQAHCADCHAQDGRDLKYFNFSNGSIVTRSRFHGLSTLQGEQIASYIRSLQVPNPGRPWNPPYQPGPGLDAEPVANWAAGAGIGWVLDGDADALPHLLRAHNSTVTTASTPTAAFGLRELAGEVTPDLFRPDDNLSPREIPIALQLPDWNEWLPRIHPKDAWGPAFVQSELGKLYGDGMYSETKREARKSSLPALLAATGNPGSDLRPVAAAFARWSDARRIFLKHSVKARTGWSPVLTDRVYSTQLWQMVKTWELTQEFGLEARGPDLYGSTADSRSWFNTLPGDTAPAVTHIPNGTNGVGGSALTNTYFTAAWYELQILLNSGNHQHRDRSPVDWVYLIGWFHDLYTQTHQPEPVRLLVTVIKALQSTDPHLGPEDLRRGWRPEKNIDPRIMISPAWAPIFRPLPLEVRRAVTTGLLTAWINKSLQYPVAKYLPLGSPPQTYSPRTYGEITGGEVWQAARQFRDTGVPEDVVKRLVQWGTAYGDRAARLQYEGHSASGKK